MFFLLLHLNDAKHNSVVSMVMQSMLDISVLLNDNGSMSNQIEFVHDLLQAFLTKQPNTSSPVVLQQGKISNNTGISLDDDIEFNFVFSPVVSPPLLPKQSLPIHNDNDISDFNSLVDNIVGGNSLIPNIPVMAIGEQLHKTTFFSSIIQFCSRAIRKQGTITVVLLLIFSSGDQ